MEYDWKFKLDCVRKYKEGKRDFVPSGISRKGFLKHVRSWAKAFDDLGIDGLRHNSSNKRWAAEQRFDLVAKVLSGDSITNVTKNAHIGSGQLYQWVRKYREKGMDGLECLKKGGPQKEGPRSRPCPKRKPN